jgi:transcription regulator
LAWQRDVAAALDPLGLTHSQFVLLACAWWLEAHGGAGTQVMIAAQAGMDVKTASQVLRRLEAAGYVSRQQPPGDARARIVSTTAAGREMGDRALSAVEAVDEAYFASRPRLRDALIDESGSDAHRSGKQEHPSSR